MSALHRRHPGNPLFARSPQLTNERALLYHFTSETALESIARHGLRPRSTAMLSPARLHMETIWEAAAPPGRHHLTAIFGFPVDHAECLHHQQQAVDGGWPGYVALTVAVDRQRALVADVLTWNSAAWWLHFKNDEAAAQKEAERYWRRSLALDEYLARPHRAQSTRIPLPEVLVQPETAADSAHIAPHRIGVAGYLRPPAAPRLEEPPINPDPD